MAGARSVVQPKKPRKIFKRIGGISKAEKTFVAQFVADQPQSITPQQVTGLAKTLRRSKETVLAMIDQAKENFVTAGEAYVDIHMRATEAALASGTDKGLEVASKAAQWAMENIAVGSNRIVETATKGASGPRIMIGVKIGSLNDDVPAVAVTTNE